MRRPATLCAGLTFTLLAPFVPARAVDGALDTTFGSAGKTRVFFDRGTTDEDRGHDVAVDALGRIVVVGIVEVTGVQRWGVTRLLADGVLDTSFSPNANPALAGRLVLDTYVADPAHPPVVAVWDRLDDDPDLMNDIAIAGGVGGGLDTAAFCAVNSNGSGFACGQRVYCSQHPGTSISRSGGARSTWQVPPSLATPTETSSSSGV
jgi:hypothetical protein